MILLNTIAKNLETILRWTLAIIFIVLFFWLGFTHFNFGNALKWILGKKQKETPSIKDTQGLEIGKPYPIKPNRNPFRDKGQVELEDGTKIELPPGIQDTNLTEIIVVEPEVTDVEAHHDRLTDMFNQPIPAPGSGESRGTGKAGDDNSSK